MKLWKTEEAQVKILFVISVGVLLAVLLPLFGIAYYNFRSVDDFSYAENAEAVWEESHSVIQVLKEQISYAKDYYNSWQGTYFAEWFTTSMMGIFSKNAYYMGTYLSLGSFVLAEGTLFLIIFLKILHTDIYRGGIVTASCLSFQILFTPVPCEAYFWFCGAVLYTFSHALGLFLLATLIALFYADKKWKTILLEVLAIFFTVAVGGSNYVTGLTILSVYILITLWIFYKKNSKKWLYLCNAILYIAAFVLNILAPGNQKRLNVAGAEQISAVTAILRSLEEAATYIATNTILPCVILAMLFLPLFIHIVRKSRYRYPLPLLITLLSFGVFASQFTPTLYTLGIVGAGRILNLYRLNFYVFFFGNELYWTGWLVRRLEERYEVLKKDDSKRTCNLLLPGWCLGGVLLCYTLIFWGGNTLTSVSALKSLRDGGAKQYYQEYQERLELLEDTSVREVTLEPFSYKPYVLYFGDITVDPDDWVNYSMAQYFGKDAVMLAH